MDLKVIPNIKHLESDNFFLIAGPCAIEGEEMALKIAENCVKICDKLKSLMFSREAIKKLTEVELIVSLELEMKKH